MAKDCSKDVVSRMDKRITIQTVTQTTDNQGGYTEAWATLATVWASIEPIKAYEKFQAAQLQTPISHKIMTRYRSGITTAQRISWSSRIFNIKEVINVNEANAFLKIIAIEV